MIRSYDLGQSTCRYMLTQHTHICRSTLRSAADINFPVRCHVMYSYLSSKVPRREDLVSWSKVPTWSSRPNSVGADRKNFILLPLLVVFFPFLITFYDGGYILLRTILVTAESSADCKRLRFFPLLFRLCFSTAKGLFYPGWWEGKQYQ